MCVNCAWKSSCGNLGQYHVLSLSHPRVWALPLIAGSPAYYLNAVVVCFGGRHGFESTVLVADFCRQQVDDFLYLLHSLRNLLAPQVHLGMRRSGKR